MASQDRIKMSCLGIYLWESALLCIVMERNNQHCCVVLCCVKSGIKDRNEKIRSCVQDGIGGKSRLKWTCRDSRERKHQHLA